MKLITIRRTPNRGRCQRDGVAALSFHCEPAHGIVGGDYGAHIRCDAVGPGVVLATAVLASLWTWEKHGMRWVRVGARQIGLAPQSDQQRRGGNKHGELGDDAHVLGGMRHEHHVSLGRIHCRTAILHR